MKLTSPFLLERREREDGEQHADRARQRDLGPADEPVVAAAGLGPALLDRALACGVGAQPSCAKMSCSGQPARSSRARVGQEIEAGLGERRPLLAREPLVELLLQLVEVAHVARGIFALRVAELVRAPVAGLLLLGDVDVRAIP